jgi:hypothetical protein
MLTAFANLSSFDELQLTDIATATLVQGVLLHFWRLGGVLLSTSNRLPSDLYGGGVQKKRIESFISCLKAASTGVVARAVPGSQRAGAGRSTARLAPSARPGIRAGSVLLMVGQVSSSILSEHETQV